MDTNLKNRNYKTSPRNEFINCYFVEGCFCGSNGQCILCQEWIKGKLYYPELVRDEKGFVICPKCGVSYGKDALTGEEYRNDHSAMVSRRSY